MHGRAPLRFDALKAVMDLKAGRISAADHEHLRNLLAGFW